MQRLQLLFAIPFLAVELLAGDPAGSEKAKPEDPKSKPSKGSKAQSTQTSPLPWKLNRSYHFSWIHQRKKVGESNFQISIVDDSKEKDSKEKSSRKVYQTTSHYRYEREGSSLNGGHECVYDSTFQPLRFTSFHRHSGVTERASHQRHEGYVRGNRLVNVVIHNDDTKNAIQLEMEAPRGAFLLLNQALDNWAILIGVLLTKPVDVKAKIIYPDLLKIYDLQFTFEAEEVLKLDESRSPLCRRYSFQSKERQFTGKVWVDRKGRMVQHQQGDLRIYLED